MLLEIEQCLKGFSFGLRLLPKRLLFSGSEIGFLLCLARIRPLGLAWAMALHRQFHSLSLV